MTTNFPKPSNWITETMEQGATFKRTLSYKDSNGAAVDLSGYIVRGMLRRNYGDASPALDMASMLSIGSPASGGVINWVVPAASTDTLNGSYVFDIEIQSGGGEVTRLIQGEMIIIPEVTR